MLTRIKLRKLSALDAKLNSVIGKSRIAHLSIGEESAQIEVSTKLASPDLQNDVSVCFDTEHGLINMQPAGALVRVLTGMDVPDMEHCTDALFRKWAVQVATQRLPDTWRQLFDIKKIIEGISAPVEATLTLLVHFPGRDWTLGMCVSGTIDTLAGIFSSSWWRTSEPDGSRFLDTVRVKRPVVFATSKLSMRQFANIDTDDLIFVDSTIFDPDGEGYIQFGCIRMYGHLIYDELNLQFQFEQWRAGMDDRISQDMLTNELYSEDGENGEDSEHGDYGGDGEHDEDEESGEDEERDGHAIEAKAGQASLNDLPLALIFEVGSVDLRLAELRQLERESIIDLGQLMPPFVRIRCNGIEVGRGELVEIDGRLAVQVKELWGRYGDKL